MLFRSSGNDRLYENVVRRELRIRPGQLFSKEDLMRSLREIQQMGHFDPEKLDVYKRQGQSRFPIKDIGVHFVLFRYGHIRRITDDHIKRRHLFPVIGQYISLQKSHPY